MDRAALIELIATRAAGDQEFAALVAARADAAVAAALSVGRTALVPLTITELGVLDTLGTIDGEAFLAGLEAFAGATLPDGHPFAAHHAGIKRALSWLKDAKGLDIGSGQAQTMLASLGAAGVVNAQHAAAIAALARRPAPISVDEVSHALNAGA